MVAMAMERAGATTTAGMKALAEVSSGMTRAEREKLRLITAQRSYGETRVQEVRLVGSA